MFKSDNLSTLTSGGPIVTLMNLKQQLKFYLEHREVSASQLARKAKVPKQSISGWLAGSNPRDIRQIKRVADVLGVTIDHLMFGSGEDSQQSKAKSFDALIDGEWFSGLFEVRLRRIKDNKK